MSSLNAYLQQTQRFLRDAKQEFLNVADLTEYVNRARREVAMRAQCVRRLTPVSGSVVSASVIASGAGYSNTPTITVTPPDFPSGFLPKPGGDQATAQAIVSGGSIAAIDITYGGYGYQFPTVAITDTTGSGATATLSVPGLNMLQPNQEQYSFSDIDVSTFPGVDSAFSILSMAVIYNNYRYALPLYSFSTYQAMIRQYPFQFTYVPSFASQYGQGNAGTFFVYPIPAALYAWEFDMLCLPQDLIDDQSVDVIPMPWSDAVAYFAAHLAYNELQNWNAAGYYLKLFDQMHLRYSGYARPGRVTNPYGRY